MPAVALRSRLSNPARRWGTFSIMPQPSCSTKESRMQSSWLYPAFCMDSSGTRSSILSLGLFLPRLPLMLFFFLQLHPYFNLFGKYFSLESPFKPGRAVLPLCACPGEQPARLTCGCVTQVGPISQDARYSVRYGWGRGDVLATINFLLLCILLAAGVQLMPLLLPASKQNLIADDFILPFGG